MHISDYLEPSRILVRERASKEPLLGELVRCLAEQGLIRSWRPVVEAVLRREQQVSTGLGGGLAVPHARIGPVEGLALALAVVTGGMDYAALDGEPVHVVLLFVSPEADPRLHSELLGAAATVFGGPDGTARLVEAAQLGGAAAVLRALRDSER